MGLAGIAGGGTSRWEAGEWALGPFAIAAVPGPSCCSHPVSGRGWPPDFFLSLLPARRMCPIFQISNVTGENLDLLKMFLNLLSPRTSYREEEPAEFQIDDTYSVPVSGS